MLTIISLFVYIVIVVKNDKSVHNLSTRPVAHNLSLSISNYSNPFTFRGPLMSLVDFFIKKLVSGGDIYSWLGSNHL